MLTETLTFATYGAPDANTPLGFRGYTAAQGAEIARLKAGKTQTMDATNREELAAAVRQANTFVPDPPQPLTLDDLRTAELDRMRPVYDSAMAYHSARYSAEKMYADAILEAWFNHNSACQAAAKQEQADA